MPPVHDCLPYRGEILYHFMLRQILERIYITSQGRGFYDLTGHATRFVEKCGVEKGLLTLYLQHTSASLLIQENADPEVRRDLERFFSRLVPDGDKLFHHTAEGPDDMPAHIRTALTAVSVSIPIENGNLALGTWQGIYLWEHRLHGHRRIVSLHLLGE